MRHGYRPNMQCPNCGEEIEIFRTRKLKRDLYVTEHPDNACPTKFRLAAFRMTVEECEEAYTRYRKELING